MEVYLYSIFIYILYIVFSVLFHACEVHGKGDAVYIYSRVITNTSHILNLRTHWCGRKWRWNVHGEKDEDKEKLNFIDNNKYNTAKGKNKSIVARSVGLVH